MSDIRIHILDHKSLIRLNDAIDYCGDSFLRLLPKVDNYLKNNIQAFERQRDVLKELLDEAEIALREAETALSDCESSQHEEEDEDGHKHITPSCDWQRGAVNVARKHRDECKKNYDKACEIVSKCKTAYEDEYKHIGGMLTPPGAEKTLEYLAQTHTDEANRIMNDIIADVEAYLEIPHEELSENEGMPYDKQQKFNEASERIKDLQKSDSNYNQVANANVETICPGCHRPIPICICPRIRERIR